MASQERWTAAAADVLGTPVAAAVPLSRRRQGGGVLMLLGFVAFAVVVVLFVSGIVPGPRLLAYFLGALVMSVLIQLGQEPVFAAQTAHGIQMIGSSRWTRTRQFRCSDRSTPRPCRARAASSATPSSSVGSSTAPRRPSAGGFRRCWARGRGSR